MSQQFVDCKVYLASDHRCAYTEGDSRLRMGRRGFPVLGTWLSLHQSGVDGMECIHGMVEARFIMKV
jgi:hypothetical protein